MGAIYSNISFALLEIPSPKTCLRYFTTSTRRSCSKNTECALLSKLIAFQPFFIDRIYYTMVRMQYQVGNKRNSSPTLEVGVFLLKNDWIKRNCSQKQKVLRAIPFLFSSLIFRRICKRITCILHKLDIELPRYFTKLCFNEIVVRFSAMHSRESCIEQMQGRTVTKPRGHRFWCGMQKASLQGKSAEKKKCERRES